jgi:predicted transcriptional regulator
LFSYFLVKTQIYKEVQILLGMKQVKRDQQDLYLTLLNLLKQGLNPSKISKQLNLKKQTLQYYLTTLKKKGIIEKKGYGTWQVKEVQVFNSNTLSHNSKSVRGHAFIWTIKLPQETKGWVERLNRLKIPYKLIRGQTPRIYLGKKKVWLGKKTMTLYEPNSFYGQNAIESRKYAIWVLIQDLRALEKRLQFKLGSYVFSPSREHFALIKNDLAKQCNKEGDKIVVKDYNGDWLWVDASDGIGELETGNHNALVNNIGVQKWWNDMKQTKFEVTPSFILNSMNQVTQNQLMFNQNFESHVSAIRELGDSVRKLTEQVIKLEEENRKLRDGNL